MQVYSVFTLEGKVPLRLERWERREIITKMLRLVSLQL